MENLTVAAASFQTSERTELLDEALALAQGEIGLAIKGSDNPAFKRGDKVSKYADLTAIWSVCREPLSKHKIAVTQWPVHSSDGHVHMVTRVAHAGQWILGHFSIPVSRADAQGYGSAVTYLKRFSLAAAVGVVTTDEDDDGNTAVEKDKKNQKAESKSDSAVPLVSAAQRKAIFEAGEAAGMPNSEIKLLLKNVGAVDSSRDLPVSKFETVMTAIKEGKRAE